MTHLAVLLGALRMPTFFPQEISQDSDHRPPFLGDLSPCCVQKSRLIRMIIHPTGKMSAKQPVLSGGAGVKRRELQDKARLTFTVFRGATVTSV